MDRLVNYSWYTEKRKKYDNNDDSGGAFIYCM